MRNSLFNRAAGVFAAVLVLFTAFGVLGCQPEDGLVIPENVRYLSSSDKICGQWTNDAGVYTESYTFKPESFHNGTIADPESGYAGESLFIYEIDSTSGYVYFRYTRSFDASSSTYYSENGADVGKWYAVYYSDLKTVDGVTTVKVSGAYGSVSSTDTLEEAVETFTDEYFTYSSTVTKQ